MSKKSTALLLILDGWGHREATDSNAIANELFVFVFGLFCALFLDFDFEMRCVSYTILILGCMD